MKSLSQITNSYIYSIKGNGKGIVLMLISSILVSFGQLFWKISSEKGFFYILSGFVLYGIGAIIMIIAYRYGSLSVLQPMLSLNYVMSLIFGSYILNENIGSEKVIGVIIIIFGGILIGGGDKK